MPAEAVVASTTTGAPVCLQCDIIAKSGKSSCCGRGGSWFGNCGSAGNAKLRHTWYEGIRVCEIRLQSKRVSGRHSHAAQRLKYSNGVDTGNPKAVMATAKALVFTSVNSSIQIPFRTPDITPANGYTEKSTVTSTGTSAEYDAGKASFKALAMTTPTMAANTLLTSTQLPRQ